MKRFVALMILVAFIVSFSGCSGTKNIASDGVTFYYIRSEYEYHSDENIIVAEPRDLSGSKDDLSYMLTLYMLGPIKENLVSPFPSRARIVDIKEEGSDITITLSGMDTLLSDSRFALAAGCLALTVFEIKDCTAVSIYSGERNITMTRESLILNDQVAQDSKTLEETQ